MKSPFPGMDPYLEQSWRDVHATLVSAARERLNRLLPRDLVARSDDCIYMESESERLRSIDPEVTEHFLEILEVNGERVVTVIEFISPASKVPGPGRDSYLENRREILLRQTNLVEIDLVRAGDWLGLLQLPQVPPEYQTIYRACVRLVDRFATVGFYPM